MFNVLIETDYKIADEAKKEIPTIRNIKGVTYQCYYISVSECDSFLNQHQDLHIDAIIALYHDESQQTIDVSTHVLDYSPSNNYLKISSEKKNLTEVKIDEIEADELNKIHEYLLGLVCRLKAQENDDEGLDNVNSPQVEDEAISPRREESEKEGRSRENSIEKPISEEKCILKSDAAIVADARKEMSRLRGANSPLGYLKYLTLYSWLSGALNKAQNIKLVLDANTVENAAVIFRQQDENVNPLAQQRYSWWNTSERGAKAFNNVNREDNSYANSCVSSILRTMGMK